MSLYDGLDISSSGKPKKEQSDEKSGGSWSSAGLKLLHSQIQLKKATLTQRDKTRTVQSGSSTVSPVVDLTNRSKGKPTETDPQNTVEQSKTTALAPSPSLLKPRKPLVIDGPPLSFVSIFAKEEKVMIFGEVVVEDEYNPLFPNDYEKLMAHREEEKRRQREEERKRELEEREKRRKERTRREQEDEEVIEKQKRTSGAAIAPPPNLLEEDRKILEEPAPPFTPDFGSGSKGLGVAAKIMEKYGYKQGAGLGRQMQGMSTALQVAKTSLRGGKIIHESMLKDEEEETESPPPPAAPAVSSDGFAVPQLPPAPPPAPPVQPTPITEVLKNPTKLVLLKNMVGSGEVDNELEPEVKEEMAKYGDVQKCLIYEMPPPVAPDEAVRIFVEFGRVDQAIKAVVDLNGRYFGGRLVKAEFYDVDKFKRFELTW